MRSLLSVAVLAGVLSIASVGFAAPAQAAKAKPAAKATSTSAAQKAARGVVKSVSDSSLVIESGSKSKPKDMTFVLNPATQKAGAVAVGSTVSVRYHTDGAQNVATAVNASAQGKSKT